MVGAEKKTDSFLFTYIDEYVYTDKYIYMEMQELSEEFQCVCLFFVFLAPYVCVFVCLSVCLSYFVHVSIPISVCICVSV